MQNMSAMKKNKSIVTIGSIFSLLLALATCDEVSTKRAITRDFLEKEQQQQHRHLAQPSLIDYVPVTQVADYAAIDRDQIEIQSEFGKILLGSESSASIFENARDIYGRGANAKSYAYIGIISPLLTDYPKGTYVSGNSTEDLPVCGTLMLNASKGDTHVFITYDATDLHNPSGECRVGGSPNPILKGCFRASGEMWIGTDEYVYNYDPKTSNMNDLTIHELSSKAESTMYLCDGHCPYEDYLKFYNYYGKFDYADEFIRIAFEKEKTEFTHGNADFTAFGNLGLTEFISEATILLNIWMYVIGQMEKAIDSCTDQKCSSYAEGACRDPDTPYNVHNWDQAVAFYVGIEQLVGTMDQQPQSTGGFLLYNLANKYCTRFGTCGKGGNSIWGEAQVNREILGLFESGKQYLLSGDCFEARRMKEAVVALMTIPLIQGTLYSTYNLENNPRSEAFHGAAAVNAAALLPIIHSCSAADALTIYNHLRAQRVPAGGSPRFFAEVKAALENNYDCIGISCSMVGGILRKSGHDFSEFAAPCGKYELPSTTPGQSTDSATGSSSSGSNSNNNRPSSDGSGNFSNKHRRHYGVKINLIATVSAAVLVLLSGFCVLILCRTWKEEPIIKDGDIGDYGIEIKESQVLA